MGSSTNRRRAYRLLFAAALLLLLTIILLTIVLGPPTKPLLFNIQNSSRVVLDSSGQLMRITLTSDEQYRVWTPLSEISPELVRATLAYEDQHFYLHPGLNPFSLLRAAWHSYVLRSRAIGGSTLTMQLARMRWQLDTRSIPGKLKQIWQALLLEWHFSKDEILEAYLNLAPYGGNIQGVGAASWVYFHRPPNSLKAEEALALTLIPQNPRKRGPLSKTGQQALGNAARLTLANANPDSENEANPSSLGSRLVVRDKAALPFLAPHFSERVIELHPDQMVLASTLQLPVQRVVEQSIKSFLERNQPLGLSNATALVVNTLNMEVIAYVGSAEYLDPTIRGFVNGLKAQRSPGSVIKPFIYALAIDQGLITPDTLLKDTPVRFVGYQPENFERNFVGPISASEALVRSRNVPAINLTAQLKNPPLFHWLQTVGVNFAKSELFYGVSIALGAFEISMEKLAELYAALNNRGNIQPLKWLRGAEYLGLKRGFSPEAAFLVQQMLQKNPRVREEYGAMHNIPKLKVGWKTGTSFGSRDAWAIGLAGPYLIGSWIGNFDGKPNSNFVGRDAAGPLLFGIIDGLQQELAIKPLLTTPPQALKKIEICPLTGAPRGAHCPQSKSGWIIPGVSPISPCSVHRQIAIDKLTGLRVCPNEQLNPTNTEIETRVYEVWESDLLKLFAQAGLSRSTPPRYNRLCQLAESVSQAQLEPKIVSPNNQLKYQVKSGLTTPIELSASHDGSRSGLYWFVNNEFVGQGQTVIWQGGPGNYTVKVTDDQGLTAQTGLTIEVAERR